MIRYALITALVLLAVAIPAAHSGSAPRDLTVANLYATQNVVSAGSVQGGGIVNAIDGASNVVTWLGGTVDPRGAYNAPSGSLYSLKVGTELGTSGELWFKHGPADTDWVRIYPATP